MGNDYLRRLLDLAPNERVVVAMGKPAQEVVPFYAIEV